ncbi:hypothetical protein [Georgenia ruanii]|uniref:hypothetical protein n=1 Tax=Georgenia ruanii TaxID=348442 RepID=UPI0012651C2A|nr:hypothetical protein [Georgenia ruanii]
MLLTAVISGCSTDEDAQAVESAATQPATPSEELVTADPPADEPIDDAAICTAYGDVLTILENADLGLDDGRMAEQEHEGWYQLATRVLDRLPSSGGGAVRDAIADLQDVAPAIPSGAGEDPAGVRSTEWYAAEEVLGAACDDLGVPLAINVFTGG